MSWAAVAAAPSELIVAVIAAWSWSCWWWAILSGTLVVLVNQVGDGYERSRGFGVLCSTKRRVKSSFYMNNDSSFLGMPQSLKASSKHTKYFIHEK